MSEQNIDNRLLYKYIQMAFEHVSRMSPMPITGKPLDVLSRLYRQRLESLFGTETDASAEHFASFDQVQAWIIEERTRHANEIIVGQVDQFVVNADAPELFAAASDQYRHAFRLDMAKDGILDQLGLDAYATYLPIHFFFSGDQFSTNWGIYISEIGIGRLASCLRHEYQADQGSALSPEQDGLFLEIAYQILLRHELAHFRVESFALNAELCLQRPLYAPYLRDVYAETYFSDSCYEEALANATILKSTKIRGLFKSLKYDHWERLIADSFLKEQPPGYRNYDLQYEWARDTSPFENEFVGYHWPWRGLNNQSVPANKLTLDARRLTMNYLCNQIITGRPELKQAPIPFFAFFPDNYFLRAENLVPIHIVKSLDPTQSFIEFPTPKKKVWESFLRALGYCPTNRGNGDHVQWECLRPGWPPIGVNYKNGELDYNAFKSALKTLNGKPADVRYFQVTKSLPDHLIARMNGSAIAV